MIFSAAIKDKHPKIPCNNDNSVYNLLCPSVYRSCFIRHTYFESWLVINPTGARHRITATVKIRRNPVLHFHDPIYIIVFFWLSKLFPLSTETEYLLYNSLCQFVPPLYFCASLLMDVVNIVINLLTPWDKSCHFGRLRLLEIFKNPLNVLAKNHPLIF